MAELIPQHDDYDHSEGNSDSHLKSSLVGAQETVIISNDKLLLGTWQSIYFCEFDGPRSRRIHIKIM
ncbi:MAG: YjbQ family protein [Fibrobacteres bacterium]|nr:YjbQ family protein [Fibrobacterota bacterium]